MQIVLMIFIILKTTAGQIIMAQTKGIIVDKEARQPIPYASIFTKNGESVLSAMSDENGQFTIGFPYQTLFFSHINYEKIELKKLNPLRIALCRILQVFTLKG